MDGQVVRQLDVGHTAGQINDMPQPVFHTVRDVEPYTLTLMRLALGKRGDWGHLDVDTGVYTPASPDPGFTARYAALNPHLR
jgi:hypothetical protein